MLYLLLTPTVLSLKELSVDIYKSINTTDLVKYIIVRNDQKGFTYIIFEKKIKHLIIKYTAFYWVRLNTVCIAYGRDMREL